MRKIITALAVFAVFISCFMPREVYASDPLTGYMTNWPYMEDIGEDSAVLIDAENGAILYSLNRDTQRYPASITKVMTCLLTLENADLSDVVTMTETGMAEAYIASQLAEFVGGSVPAFVDMMNARAAGIGCTGTHFHNAHGLPDEEHWTTANDMALILREALRNSEFRKIISTQVYKVGPTNTKEESRVYENHFKLILPESEWYYENAIGGKTGYTDSAWRTLVGAAEKDGRTLVCVTMHGPDANDFGDMKRLFEYGFNNFKNVPVTGSDGKVLGSVTIANNFSMDDLWTEEADGRVNYYYEKIFVGSAEKEVLPTVTAAPTETPTEAPAVTETPAATETPAVTEAPAPTKAPEKESGVLMSLVRVLLVVLVLGVLLLAIVLYKRHLDSERKKRRIRRKKKG